MSIHDWQANQNFSPAAVREALGRIPLLLNPDSYDPVWLQLKNNESWNPEPAGDWMLTQDHYLISKTRGSFAPRAMTWHGSEQIFVYAAGWTTILQLNGDFTVVRIKP